MGNFFVLENWLVVSRTDGEREAKAEASLKIRVKEEIIHEAADGVGPVDALANALRKALKKFYPEVDDISLRDYIVHIEDSQKGTAAEVKVITELEKGKLGYMATGVSANILEASWQALVDGFSHLLEEKDG